LLHMPLQVIGEHTEKDMTANPFIIRNRLAPPAWFFVKSQKS